MKSVFFLFLICLPSVALPDPVLSSDVTRRLENTVVRVEDSSNGNHCSVFPITPDGYALTALHCVISCLDKHGLIETGRSLYFGLENLTVVTQTYPPQLMCENLSIQSLGVTAVQLIALGPSLTSFNPVFLNQYPVFYNELKIRGLESRASDFALVKLAVSSDVACLNFALPQAGQNLWSTGYAETGDAKHSAVFKATQGALYGDISESFLFKSLKNTADQTWAKSVYAEEGVLFSSSRSQPGQSGGPVILADGTVIGVISGNTSTPTTFGDVLELVATSVDHVLRSLPPNLTSALRDKNRLCH